MKKRSERLTTPRRQPRRSSATEVVEAILKAAGMLVERDGLEGLTTNAVARVAGVSVGSLYQYFPNKLAIVTELARRMERGALRLMAVEQVGLANASAREAVARIVHLARAPGLGTGELRRALLRDVPRGWILPETRVTDLAMQNGLIAFFLPRAAELRAPPNHRTVFVVQHALEGAAEAVLLASPEAMTDLAVPRELFRLVWSHLAADGDSLAMPVVESGDLPPLRAEPDDAMVTRLLHEPSRRRERKAGREPASERGAATRDAVVASAERVLTDRGFAGLSVRSIAREAGVALGALYHHFANAQAVIEELARRVEQRFTDALAAGLSAANSPAETAHALVDAYTHPRVVAHSLRRALLLEAPRRWTEEAALDVAAVEHLARAFARHASAAQAGDPALTAFFSLHAVRAVIESALVLEPEDLPMDALREELTALVIRHSAASFAI